MPSYVVTGAARGIGFEFVHQLSSSPENIVIALVRSKTNSAKLEALNAKNVHIFEADITDVKALLAAAKSTSEITGGSLDVLINNAARVGLEGLGLKTFADYVGDATKFVEDIDKSFKINVEGPIFTINAFLPLLRLGSQKKVITLSSGLGDPVTISALGLTMSAGYCISKAAVTMLNVNYANVFKEEGFIFLSLSPSLVNTRETPMTPEELEGTKAMLKTFQKAVPSFTGKFMTPEASVGKMLVIIEGLKKEDTGKFERIPHLTD